MIGEIGGTAEEQAAEWITVPWQGAGDPQFWDLGCGLGFRV